MRTWERGGVRQRLAKDHKIIRDKFLGLKHDSSAKAPPLEVERIFHYSLQPQPVYMYQYVNSPYLNLIQIKCVFG